jgi:hypothetical protein
MREFRPYGSVRGARGDARPYRDRQNEAHGDHGEGMMALRAVCDKAPREAPEFLTAP